MKPDLPVSVLLRKYFPLTSSNTCTFLLLQSKAHTGIPMLHCRRRHRSPAWPKTMGLTVQRRAALALTTWCQRMGDKPQGVYTIQMQSCRLHMAKLTKHKDA